MKARPSFSEEVMFKEMEMDELLYKEEVYQIVGAAIEVHRELGPGFLEAVYQEAIEIELKNRLIPFSSQRLLGIFYKGIRLNKEYLADLLCFDKIIVELKAIDRLSRKEESQILNYLKAANMRVGVLINFGSVGKLEWKRFVR
jgi:GxxExxY protein